MDMLLSLVEKKPKSLTQESEKSTEILYASNNYYNDESFDDVITAGCDQVMSHKDRYEFVKKRTYSLTKPIKN
ncbi:hypothetical protein CFPU101_49190 [Chroococcus sp. FPU101]|nr:hypothetical protein CFPU101_49190 [Chroococcus sp. FPU101]